MTFSQIATNGSHVIASCLFDLLTDHDQGCRPWCNCVLQSRAHGGQRLVGASLPLEAYKGVQKLQKPCLVHQVGPFITPSFHSKVSWRPVPPGELPDWATLSSCVFELDHAGKACAQACAHEMVKHLPKQRMNIFMQAGGLPLYRLHLLAANRGPPCPRRLTHLPFLLIFHCPRRLTHLPFLLIVHCPRRLMQLPFLLVNFVMAGLLGAAFNSMRMWLWKLRAAKTMHLQVRPFSGCNNQTNVETTLKAMDAWHAYLNHRPPLLDAGQNLLRLMQCPHCQIN